MDNMQLWLSSSTDSINLNDSAEGFYLNPDLEGLTGLPEIRSVNGLNAGYDGGWTATQLWAARLITIRGVIAINDKAAVETKRKALAKLLAQGKNEDLELRFVSEAGNTYTTTVRTTNCTMALQRVFWRQEYQIQLRANDPLIYDDGGSELVAILRVMAGEGGFEIPFDIPFTIGGSIDPTSVDVGDEATYPLIRLKGDLHNPTIINMTTNQRMQVLADIITTIEWHDYTTTYTTDGYKQIGDGLDGAPLSLTHLYGNATQKTLSGKNKANYLDTIPSSGNTTLTFIDNGFKSVTNASGYGSRLNMSGIKASTTYTISFTLKIVSATSVRLRIFKGTTQQALYVDKVLSSSGTYNATFTTDAAETDFNIWFYNGVPGAGDTEWTFLQVEESSSPTSYEPYVGGVPMPNPQFPSPVKTVTGLQTVKITGKNLLSGDYAQFDNIGGTGSTYAYFKLPMDGDYTLTLKAKNNIPANSGRYIGFTVKGGNANTSFRWAHAGNFTAISAGDTTTINNTYNSTEKYAFVSMYPKSDLILQWFVDNFEIQLELGNQATSYEPYQSQSQEINLGKNLFHFTENRSVSFDGMTLEASAGNSSFVLDGTTGSAQGPSLVRTTAPLRLRAGVYTAKIEGLNTKSTSADRVYVAKASAPGTAIAYMQPDNDWTYTFTVSDDDDFVLSLIVASSSSYTNKTITVQIEAGSQATSYAPYFTPIELAKIPNTNYTDGFRIIDGTWYIHKEVGKRVYTGASSEAWSGNSYGGLWRAYITIPDIFVTQNNPDFEGISDHFYMNVGVLGAASIKEGMFCQYRNTKQVYFATPSSATDNATWKTWLASNPTTIYYQLATPTDTEITDSELIEQLNQIYSLYQGTNNLWLIPSAGAQGEMEVSYATTEDIDYHEVVIDCQARTVTQDGRNLYPALAEGSEFIRLLPGENKLYLTSEVESDNGTAEVKFKKGNISI